MSKPDREFHIDTFIYVIYEILHSCCIPTTHGAIRCDILEQLCTSTRARTKDWPMGSSLCELTKLKSSSKTTIVDCLRFLCIIWCVLWFELLKQVLETTSRTSESDDIGAT